MSLAILHGLPLTLTTPGERVAAGPAIFVVPRAYDASYLEPGMIVRVLIKNVYVLRAWVCDPARHFLFIVRT
jgi:hypothetical protein